MNSKPVGEVFPTALAYYDKYEQLRNNNAFVSGLASIALTGASQSFSLNRAKEALEYLNEFEKIFRHDLEVSSYLISDSYTAAAVYYFGKGKKASARGRNLLRANISQLVLCNIYIVGYNLLSFMRASAVVNRQLIPVWFSSLCRCHSSMALVSCFCVSK